MKNVLRSFKENRFVEWIIYEFCPEFKHLLKLAWPIIVMNIFRFLNPAVSVIMCGHLNKIEFDAAAMANAIINVFGVSVDLGFSTACDTLFSQIYGSRKKNKLGLMLQRAMLVMTVLYLILACFHLNIEPLLILCKQDVEISRLTAEYVTLFLPGLFFDFHFLAISRYLQNQNVVYPMMICSGIGCVYNALVQYIAIYQLGFGIRASAIIQASACVVIFVIELLYVLISKMYVPTWQGIEFFNALEGWGIFFKLGLPGIVMIGVEEWTFEIMNFVAGAMSDVQLGGHTVAFQIEIICYMIHAGLAIGTAIRAGQHLGANKPREASLTAKVVLISDFLISVCTVTVILSFRKYLPLIFSDDREIQALAEQILLVVVGVQILDAGISSGGAIFRACGKQLIGAIVMMLSYYTLGVPLGFVFTLVLGMDIRGFWYALLIGVFVEVTIYLIIIYRIDWDEEAAKTKTRLRESRLSGSRDSKFYDLIVSEISSNEIESPLLEKETPIHLRRASSSRRPSSNLTDLIASKIMEEPIFYLDNQLNKRTLLKRLLFCSITLLLFILSVFSKIYLPRGYYIPCIPIDNSTNTLPLNKHYPFCNDTIYRF